LYGDGSDIFEGIKLAVAKDWIICKFLNNALSNAQLIGSRTAEL
jgi:hypothetical protein